MTDAMGELKAAADEGKRRRGQARLTVTVLFLVALLQIASTLTLGGFVISWRHQDKTQNAARAADAALRAKRTEDLYASANDTNQVVHRLLGDEPPAPIVPPPVAITTTTTSIRRSTTSTSASAGRSTPTTGTQQSPPPTAGPGPPQPPPPTSTTTPTTACVAVVLGRCAIPPPAQP